MESGKTFKRRGQQYECVGRFEHEVPARFVWIYELRSHCADCGRGFGLTASSGQIHNRQLSRRCENCRNPGVPVAEIAAPPSKRKAKCKARKRIARRIARTKRMPPELVAPAAARRSPPGVDGGANPDTYADAMRLLL